MADTANKLAHLLPHWVDHNTAHLESFHQWQERADREGLEEVAAALRETVAAARRVDEALRRAATAISGAQLG